MALHDELERAIAEAVRQDPAADQALGEGPAQRRGEAADALQDLLTARNALLDAAARWDKAQQAA